MYLFIGAGIEPRASCNAKHVLYHRITPPARKIILKATILKVADTLTSIENMGQKLNKTTRIKILQTSKNSPKELNRNSISSIHSLSRQKDTSEGSTKNG